MGQARVFTGNFGEHFGKIAPNFVVSSNRNRYCGKYGLVEGVILAHLGTIVRSTAEKRGIVANGFHYSAPLTPEQPLQPVLCSGRTPSPIRSCQPQHARARSLPAPALLVLGNTIGASFPQLADEGPERIFTPGFVRFRQLIS